MLPKIKDMIFEATVPSTKKKIQLRQMKVSEEKILLMARQSGEVPDFFKAISQIVNNCVIDPKIDVLKMPLFDVEYLFMKIRASSISNISKVTFRDNEDSKEYPFEIDLDKIEVVFPKGIPTTISVTPELSFSLKYPPMEMYTTKEFFDLEEDGVFDALVSVCVDKIYNKEEAFEASDQKKEELMDFINSLPASKYAELRKFFSNIPGMFHELKYKNQKGTERTITLRTIEDFFTFG